MKKENGITLIALIITIIVMLILTGVTVAVALNGGLFGTAEEATIKHEVATIQELIDLERMKLKSDKIQEGKYQEGITVEEILKSITREEKLDKVTIEGEDYITNAKEGPDNKCYRIYPEKLNISTQRGKGETGDIFIIDGKCEVYYIKSGATNSSDSEDEYFDDNFTSKVDLIEGNIENKTIKTIIDNKVCAATVFVDVSKLKVLEQEEYVNKKIQELDEERKKKPSPDDEKNFFDAIRENMRL